MALKQPTEVVSIRLERKLTSDLRKKALTERVNFSDYIRDLLFEALATQDVRIELTEILTAIEDMASDISDMKIGIQNIEQYLFD